MMTLQLPAAPNWPLPDSPRCYLFLQGPLGPFFWRLARRLRQRGHRTLRVNFNGGDLYDWPLPHARSFRGGIAEWPAYVLDLAKREGVTDVVLIGDCRPLHLAAADTLTMWNPAIRIHVYEEGYIRPDWVTLEDRGVNARSTMPRTADVIARLPEAHMPRYGVHLGASTVRMGFRAMFSYFAMFALSGIFRRYEHHRPDSALREAGLWLRRLGSRNERQHRAQLREAELLGGGHSYFLALLQLNIDKQIVFHSPFANMRDYMERVCQSFAAHAPKDHLLVVKSHPLDNGRDHHEADLMAISQRLGIAERLCFIDGGDLIRLIEGCTGVVTVNSTAGISALHRSIPLIALGNALFNVEGLCHQEGLDSFWTKPAPVDQALYQCWRNMVARRSQVNGNFYSDLGIRLVIDGSIPILEGTAPAIRDWPPMPRTEPPRLGQPVKPGKPRKPGKR